MDVVLCDTWVYMYIWYMAYKVCMYESLWMRFYVIHVCVCVYIYIYIYDVWHTRYACMRACSTCECASMWHMNVYIYIYIHIYIYCMTYMICMYESSKRLWMLFYVLCIRTSHTMHMHIFICLYVCTSHAMHMPIFMYVYVYAQVMCISCISTSKIYVYIQSQI